MVQKFLDKTIFGKKKILGGKYFWLNQNFEEKIFGWKKILFLGKMSQKVEKVRKGGGSAPKIKKSTIQNVDYSEMTDLPNGLYF